MKNKLWMMIFSIIIIVASGSVVLGLDILPTVGPGLPAISGDSGEGGGPANLLVQNFAGAMSWIGYAIAVGMTVFIGIKYVVASADEKASMKGMMVKVVIGSAIIAASSTLVLFLNSILSV